MPPVIDTLLPETAPFTSEQRAWLNGYLAGLLSADKLVVPMGSGSAPAAVETRPLLFLFGSQTVRPRRSRVAWPRKPRSTALLPGP